MDRIRLKREAEDPGGVDMRTPSASARSTAALIASSLVLPDQDQKKVPRQMARKQGFAVSSKLLEPLIESLSALSEGSTASVAVVVVDLAPVVFHDYVTSFELATAADMTRIEKNLASGDMARPLQNYIKNIHREVRAKVTEGASVVILHNTHDGSTMLKV
jgi:hypothetical protein